MQHLELLLDHHDLYCPVTGQKIIGEDGVFKPSPALIFFFVDQNESIEYGTKDVLKQYESFVQATENDFYKSYQRLVKSMETKETENYVVFSIQGNAPFTTFGPAKFCFNMNYQEKH